MLLFVGQTSLLTELSRYVIFMHPKGLRWHIKIVQPVRQSIHACVRASITNRVSAIT